MMINADSSAASDWMRRREQTENATAAPVWWLDRAMKTGDIIRREKKVYRIIYLTDTHVEVEEVSG